jgi:hypothetical protein
MPVITVPAVATAASQATAVGASPASGPIYVMGVWYRPASAVTGQNTNTRQLRLRNTSTTTDVALLQLNAGVNLSTGWNRIPLLVSPAVAAALAAATLQWESNAVGTGLADPGGTLSIRWQRELSLAQRTVTDWLGRSIITPAELALDVDVARNPNDYPGA